MQLVPVDEIARDLGVDKPRAGYVVVRYFDDCSWYEYVIRFLWGFDKKLKYKSFYACFCFVGICVVNVW